MPAKLYLYGGGGHAAVVADAALAAGLHPTGFFDDDPNAHPPMNLPRATPPPADQPPDAGWIVAIGDNHLRSTIADRLAVTLATVVHPTAWVSPSANLGDGVYVGPHAVINAHATVGRGAIINSAAIVEHHATVGPFAHIAPGAVLGGAARVGARALVGLGARVLPVITLGDDATLGAGAVATHDLPPNITAVGIPARRWV